jgi:hypothetical protein
MVTCKENIKIKAVFFKTPLCSKYRYNANTKIHAVQQINSLNRAEQNATTRPLTTLCGLNRIEIKMFWLDSLLSKLGHKYRTIRATNFVSSYFPSSWTRRSLSILSKESNWRTCISSSKPHCSLYYFPRCIWSSKGLLSNSINIMCANISLPNRHNGQPIVTSFIRPSSEQWLRELY